MLRNFPSLLWAATNTRRVKNDEEILVQVIVCVFIILVFVCFHQITSEANIRMATEIERQFAEIDAAGWDLEFMVSNWHRIDNNKRTNFSGSL